MPTETLRPNGSGDSTQLIAVGDSPNYKCVDEEISDGDTTYVRSDTTTNPLLDLYTIPASSIPAGSTINSVTLYTVCRQITTPYYPKFTGAIKKPDGTILYGATRQITSGSTAYQVFSDAFTGLSLSDLVGLQIGIQIQQISGGILWQGRCTQVYIVIDYTPPAVAKKPIMNGLVYVE